jgi:lincosamide nucleotidyltransferase A/C/D/E
MDARDACAALDALEAAGIRVVVNGGWGVDALLGEQTRDHDDLDVHVSIDDLQSVCNALAGLGYNECLVRDGRLENFVLRAAGDRRVDLHAARFDADDGGVYRMPDRSEWVWPPGSFSGTGSIGGRTVECLSFQGQLLEHTGYELDDTDRLDVARLRERFALD